MDPAFQGQEGLVRVREALAAGSPYALVILDYLMPPGWNGLETLRHLRQVAPALPVVICSAYTDYSWEEVLREFGEKTPLVERGKPFERHELYRTVLRLTEPPCGTMAGP